MDGLVMAGQLILGLTILVGLHEWGHFITARMFGIRVNKFYIFFDFLFPLPNVLNFALWKKKKGDTEYGLGWFPLGGYVDIAGMVDETKDASSLSEVPEPWEFRSKPAWQRLIVMLGGIIVNLILGVIIYIGVIYAYGEQFIPIEEVNKDGIVAYKVAQEAGLKTGDKVLKINEKPVKFFQDIMSEEVFLGQNTNITVDRDGKTIEIPIPNSLPQMLVSAKKASEGENLFVDYKYKFEVGYVPQTLEKGLFAKIKSKIVSIITREAEKDSTLPAFKAGIKAKDQIISVNNTPITYYHEFQKSISENAGKAVTMKILRGKDTITVNPIVSQSGKIGIGVQRLTLLKKTTIKYSFSESITYGTSEAFNTIWSNIKGFKKIFSGDVAFSSAVSGPVGIAKMFGPRWIWSHFWEMTAKLSMILAFMNILPIPALDGGHAVILLYEMILRRKPSEKVLERLQQVGMIILLALMVFVIFNDLR